ncbi:MAG: extracellular solute-binding protein, partial [Gammaproteobacteria bacterium]|nr:extracellular solute-binding protein [Gammaproteobacteria bacterium]
MKKISVLFWIFSLLLPLSVPAEAPQLLRVAGWGGYADPDRADKTIGYQSFEKRFNVTIAFTPLNNLDDIVSVAESELHYDVYIVSNEGIRLLYDMGLVSPINLDLLPHYQDLHHNLKYSEWAQFDSKLYAIPWAWGPTGLIYDEEAVVNPNSWNLLWDPQYRDKVALWDDPSMI